MSEYLLREYCPGDREGLTALWRQVFGDPEKVVAAFFDALLLFAFNMLRIPGTFSGELLVAFR